MSFSIPSLAQPANQSSIAGATITPLALSIADPDGSPLTITHTGLPVGLSINSATRQITGVPSAAGHLQRHSVRQRRSRYGFAILCLGGGCSDEPDLAQQPNGPESRVVSERVGTPFSANLPAVTDTNWQVVANADINRDGASDMIWRNRVTGQNLVWYLNGSTLLFAANLPTVTDTNWQIVVSADINRDGASDLIWRNRATGQNAVQTSMGRHSVCRLVANRHRRKLADCGEC